MVLRNKDREGMAKKKKKRAPGGGRKLIGTSVGRPLTIRIDDNLRGQLEVAARKRAKRKPWNLSQEILYRLRWSIDKEREDRRGPALRALCDIISNMARAHLQTDRPDAQWHREPFTFKAFKLATAKVLDALAPPGEMSAPSSKFSRNIFSPFDTPEILADYAATQSLNALFHTHPLTQEEKDEFRRAREGQHPSLHDTEYDALVLLSDREYRDYARSWVRRALGIELEPVDAAPLRGEWRRQLAMGTGRKRRNDEPREPQS
jgi:hypothetical protein